MSVLLPITARSLLPSVRRSALYRVPLALSVRKGWIKMRLFGDMSDQTFWNKFYADRRTDEPFEWFVRFEDVKEHLDPYLPPVSSDCLVRILDIGCGTSAFCVELFEHLDKKCRIDRIDFSPEAIQATKRNLKDRGLLVDENFGSQVGLGTDPDPRDLAGLACHVADAKTLPFNNDTFSLTIDKGTSDAVLKGVNGENAFIQVVEESMRVLKPAGNLVQFSDEPPELRLNLLERVKSEVSLASRSKLRFFWRDLEARSGFQHFMYVVQKEKLPNEK